MLLDLKIRSRAEIDINLLLVLGLLFGLGLEILDEGFRRLEEVLLSLRCSTFSGPVDNGLVRDTIGVVKNLEDLRECLDDSSVGVAVDLNGVDETDLDFGGITERFENGGVFDDLLESQTFELFRLGGPVDLFHDGRPGPVNNINVRDLLLALLSLEEINDIFDRVAALIGHHLTQSNGRLLLDGLVQFLEVVLQDLREVVFLEMSFEVSSISDLRREKSEQIIDTRFSHRRRECLRGRNREEGFEEVGDELKSDFILDDVVSV